MGGGEGEGDGEGMKSKDVAEEKYETIARWDACMDLGLRRFFYSSLAGAFGALLLFRTPASRWSSVAFGAGLGIGSAYSECSFKLDGSTTLPPAKILGHPASQEIPQTITSQEANNSD